MNSKLNNFVNFEREKKMLIFDVHNLAYRTLHIAYFQAPDDEDFLFWKYLMINSIFTAIKQFGPTRVIMAFDAKHSWRKDIYQNYKAQRKEARVKSKIDFELFYKALDSFIESFKIIFSNFYCLRIDKCEADDIIAIISQMDDDYKKVIISMDSDLIQLLRYKNVKIYSPIKKEFVSCLNPKIELELKILMGDKSDNIPGVKSKCGKATALKIIDSGIDIFLQNEEFKSNYQRNKQLIDFEFIPQNIINTITEEYKSYEIKKINQLQVWHWLLTNKMQKFADDISVYIPFLSRIS